MDYSGQLAAIQQHLAASDDMDTRRTAVMAALASASGEYVLEVGCGQGLCLELIAEAVGGTGYAHGIDVSPDQIEGARARCADLAQVRLEVADVRSMPLDDSTVDATVSMQVLEYIDDLDVALDEIARVTRQQGRFVNVATVWSSLFWSGGDTDLTAAVLGAWAEHCPHPDLPVELPAMLRRHGFGQVTQIPITIVNRDFASHRFSWGIARLAVAFAESMGAIGRGMGDEWIRGLEQADESESHFLSVVPVLTTATRGAPVTG